MGTCYCEAVGCQCVAAWVRVSGPAQCEQYLCERHMQFMRAASTADAGWFERLDRANHAGQDDPCGGDAPLKPGAPRRAA